MKKAIAILLVLLVAGVAFGAAEASLQVSSSVTPLTGLKISQVSAISDWETAGIATLTTPLTGVPVTDLFVNLRTNKKTSFTINIDAPDLTNTDTSISYSIPYTVAATAGDGTAADAVASGTVDQLLVSFDGDTGTGMRILSHGFTIDVDDTAYGAAVEGTYNTTIVFDIVVGS
ncbi:MAG: hypothetical protein AB7S52_01880 [Sphaerochaetaceae bacterium]